jgi:hypothetical protein
MERGVGGRIEAAFEASKERGEAAFVTFITAGYPTADGTYLQDENVGYRLLQKEALHIIDYSRIFDG